MSPMRHMLLVAALSLMVAGSPLRSDAQELLTSPTRDVDITYQITRPGQPAILERRRWLASQHLRRVDGPDKSATIFDQSRGGTHGPQCGKSHVSHAAGTSGQADVAGKRNDVEAWW
jgi:hypothetical protein